LASTTGWHTEPAQAPRQLWPHAAQLFASLVRSAHVPLQQTFPVEEQEPPEGRFWVPHMWFVHVAARHGGGAGQSATALHPATQAPLPLQTLPMLSSHGVKAAAGVNVQQPPMHARARQSVVASGQSIAAMHGRALAPQ
jgi:hypothetical protein